jgi:HSP20 family protein
MIVRRNNTLPFFSSLFDTFYNDSYEKELCQSNHTPKVNVKENDNSFELSLAVPGMKRDDFKIEINDNILTVSSEKRNEKEENENKFRRVEYSYSSFSRSFTLPDEIVDYEKIKANYNNGELFIEIPKLEEKREKKRLIKVA